MQGRFPAWMWLHCPPILRPTFEGVKHLEGKPITVRHCWLFAKIKWKSMRDFIRMIELNSMRSFRGLGGFGGCFFITPCEWKWSKRLFHTQLCYSEIQIFIFFFALLKLQTFFLPFDRLKKTKHLDVWGSKKIVNRHRRKTFCRRSWFCFVTSRLRTETSRIQN